MNQEANFEGLVQAYGNDLYRYAYWLCRDESGAEDLVQETLLRGWRGFRSLRDLSVAKAWLLTTLRREHFRRKPTRTIVSFDDLEATLEDAQNGVVSLDESIDIEQRLAALPENYREVLVLQLLFGYTTKEIADVLQTTEAAVANRLLRARRALLEVSEPERARADIIPLRGRQS